MRIQVHCVHFTADQKLLDFIQQKLNKLDTFYDRITSGEVYLRLDGADTNKVKIKIFEIKLFLPGDSIFVSEQGSTFEEATDRVIDTLKTKLTRLKDKHKNKSVRELKETQSLMEVEVVNEDTEL